MAPSMRCGMARKSPAAPKAKAWKVFLRPITSERDAHRRRPSRLPPARAIR